MRFMMIVKANKDSEAGKMPSEELLNAMGKYNEELLKGGVLLDLAGLHPSSRGARIQFTDGKRTVIDGPFAQRLCGPLPEKSLSNFEIGLNCRFPFQKILR